MNNNILDNAATVRLRAVFFPPGGIDQASSVEVNVVITLEQADTWKGFSAIRRCQDELVAVVDKFFIDYTNKLRDLDEVA